MGLYIITHKNVKQRYPKNRKIMMVGAINKKVPAEYFSDFDERKDNISNKNSSFCELTGFYYMIKNDNDSILSLEHYRRIFVKRKFYLFKYPFLTERDIEKILSKYDIILPKKVCMKETVKQYYEKNHNAKDLVELEKIISEKYPEYLHAYSKVLNGNKSYYFNMFVAKREVIVRYANWLFDILFELEKRVDISSYNDYQKRIFGFLSERLLTVYFEKNKDIKIYEMKVHQIDGNPFACQIKRFKNKLFRRSK